MSLRRPRWSEWLAAVAAVVVVVVLFALHWYGGHPPRSGFNALPALRWVVLVAAALGISTAVAQATMRAPAVPVTLDMLAMLLGGVATVLLAIRLASTSAPLAAGAYVGVVALAAMTYACFKAVRTEHGWTPGPERPVEVVSLRTPR